MAETGYARRVTLAVSIDGHDAAGARTGADDNPEILWIDWPWLLSEEKAKRAFEDIKANLFNEAAISELKDKLRKRGYFKGGKECFNLISDIPRNWKEDHHQSRQVHSSIWERALLKNAHAALLGDYNFYGLVNGCVESLKSETADMKKCFRIYIEKAAIVMRDSFDFNGEQILGLWDCPDKKFMGIDLFSPMANVLKNINFEIFREKYKNGRDFYLAAPPKFVEIPGNLHYDFCI